MIAASLIATVIGALFQALRESATGLKWRFTRWPQKWFTWTGERYHPSLDPFHTYQYFEGLFYQSAYVFLAEHIAPGHSLLWLLFFLPFFRFLTLAIPFQFWYHTVGGKNDGTWD